MEFVRYRYHAVVTNDEASPATDVMTYALGRGSMGNNLKKLLHGLSLDHSPCDEFFANWAFLLIVVFAYNLAAWLRAYGLPEEHRNITLMTGMLASTDAALSFFARGGARGEERASHLVGTEGELQLFAGLSCHHHAPQAANIYLRGQMIARSKKA